MRPSGTRRSVGQGDREQAVLPAGRCWRLILLFDSILVPGFFSIQARGWNLYGSLIDILRNASTIMLLAIGMTLVIATGGVDLSVGAVMAIAASVAALMMNPYVLAKELPPNLMRLINDPHFTFQPLWVVILVTLLVATVCGLWNGWLVAYVRIQPMVATLILMIAGRGIAQLITNGVRIQIFYEPYAFIGQGWAVLPFSLYLVAIVYGADLAADAQDGDRHVHRVRRDQRPGLLLQRDQREAHQAAGLRHLRACAPAWPGWWPAPISRPPTPTTSD